MLIVDNARDLGTLLVEAEDLPREAFEAALLRAQPHVCEIYLRDAYVMYRRSPFAWMAARSDRAGDEILAEVRRRFDARRQREEDVVELGRRFLDAYFQGPISRRYHAVGHLVDERRQAAILFVRLDRAPPEVRAIAREGTDVVLSLAKAIGQVISSGGSGGQEELDTLVAMLVCATVAERP